MRTFGHSNCKVEKKITFHIIDTGQMVAPITIKHYNVIGWFAWTIFSPYFLKTFFAEDKGNMF